MPIAKTIVGNIQIEINIQLPVTLPIFPLTVDALYAWYPNEAPSMRLSPKRGQVRVQVPATTTMSVLLTNIRAAISAQENAADNGGHTTLEAT